MVTENKDQKIAVVAGSVRDITQKQISCLVKKRNLELLKLSPEKLLTLSSPSEIKKKMEKLKQKVEEILSQSEIIVISLEKEEHSKSRMKMLADSKKLLNYIKKIFRFLVDNYSLQGMILTGGDTAVSICEEIEASGIEIIEEISSGIPAGNLLGGQLAGIKIITKAGGFGEEKDLIKAVQYLE
ncbi:MAG: nucleotide-binding domain containing protein [bacterium]